MGLWYPKDSSFELTAFLDVDLAGCIDSRKSTSGGIQILGDKLVSWMSKKQNCTLMSSAELNTWHYLRSAIAISCNPVQHSRTKHIHTRYHFIKEQVENDPVEIHNIKQRDGESSKEFVRRYKLGCRDVKGAQECMKILRFMHGITNPKLIKRLHDKIPKLVDEMMRVTTAFLRESIDSYDDLKKTFLENYLQQKKCIKDPVEIHNIKQRDGESSKEFVRRYKLGCRDVKGAQECMKILRFMHGITNPKLIKRLHDKIPKLVDEMMRVTTAFLRGEVAASNRERKKSFPS
nr:reverse transcriptase domain-containing protein [Tanacetum cinerariifolium]